MKRIIYVTLVMLAIVPVVIVCTQEKSNPKIKEIEKVIAETADYISDILLDGNGVSQCDYNLTESKWYPFEPAWHTGQAIYALTEAYRITGNEKYLKAAQKAGNWWISLEIKDHPKLKGMLNAQHGDHAGNVIVFATVSDGSAGLYQLSKACDNPVYAEVATRAGDWMLRNMCDLGAGVCYDNVDPETGEVLKQNSPFWPDKKNQKLFDVARPNNEGSLFLDMYRFTDDTTYKNAFIRLCESLIGLQGTEGLWMDFMPNFKDEGSFHPRFNLWYAESLIDGYELTGEKKYLEAARKTAETYANVQDSYGTIYYKNYLSGKKNKNSITGSAVAFAGIIWIRLKGHGIDQFNENIELSYEWLKKNRFAPDHQDPNLRGAIINTRLRHKKDKLWFVNRGIGSSFGVRFLSKYHDMQVSKNLTEINN